MFSGEEWNERFKTDEDLIDNIWTERSVLTASAIWDFPLSSAGLDTSDKLAAVRAEMKAIKNDVEIASTKHSHVKDGVSVTKLIKWIKENAKTRQLTEIGIADKLEAICREQEGYLDFIL